MKIITTLCVLALSSAVSLHAADKKKPAGDKPKASADEAFKKFDKDSSGDISLEEYKAGKPDATKAEASFKKLDANGDGKVTLEEFKAPHKAK